jgi:hypothetical protein
MLQAEGHGGMGMLEVVRCAADPRLSPSNTALGRAGKMRQILPRLQPTVRELTRSEYVQGGGEYASKQQLAASFLRALIHAG